MATVHDYLVGVGFSSAEILHGTGVGLETLMDPDCLLSARQQVAIVKRAQELAPDPVTPFKLGLRMRAMQFGMYGCAVLSVANYRQAAAFTVKFHALINRTSDLSFTEDEHSLVWHLPSKEEVRIPHLSQALYQYENSMRIGVLLRLSKDVMGECAKPRQINLPWAGGEYVREIENLLECPVIFDSRSAAVHFSGDVLNARPILSDKFSFDRFSHRCSQLHARIQESTTVSSRVYYTLMRSRGRFPSVDEVAQFMAFSARTLRRRLEAENTSFETILTTVRQALAEDYLSRTFVSIEDVGELLGYQDTRSFRSAFKKWTGLSPRDYKKAQAGGA